MNYKDKLKLKYYKDENGNVDMIAHSINCYEKVLYHAMRGYGINYKMAFCDDINLLLKSTKHIEICKNRSNIHDDLFVVEEYFPDPKKACAFIEESLKSGWTVAVNTMFDMLTPYYWYHDKSKEGISNTHLCTIIGFDRDNFYFVEDPYMTVKERLRVHPDNDTVGIIEKKVMEKAFRYYCYVLKIKIDEKKIPYIDRFEEIKKIIVKNYYTGLGEHGNYIGRKALNILSRSLENNKFLDELKKDFFWIHLMHSSRSIFLWCLQEKQSIYMNCNLLKQYLIESIEEWKILYCVVAKSVYSSANGGIDINKIIIKKANKIMEIEDKLIDAMENCKLK